LRFIKGLFLIILFLFLKIIHLLFKGSRKTVDIGVDAYKSVKNSESFDEAYKNFTSNQYSKSRLSVPEEVIALMAKVAKSDGQISRLEIEFMSDTIKSMAHAMEQAGLPKAIIEVTKKRLFTLANQAKQDDNPTAYYCQSLKQTGIEVRRGALLQMISFATLDGLSDDTKELIFEIGGLFDFSHEEVEQFIDQVRGGSAGSYASTFADSDPYKVLECNESDDFSTIKKAYRRLVKQNHPDFMHGQGMDDKDIQQATIKMQDINAAYEEIKRRRGE